MSSLFIVFVRCSCCWRRIWTIYPTVWRRCRSSSGPAKCTVTGSLIALTILPCINTSYRRRATKITNRAVAAGVIQQFGRCIIARNRILKKADESYRRILDEASDTYYYANIFNGETSWYKLKLYLTRFPPIMLQREAEELVKSSRSSSSKKYGGGSGGGSSKKRHNPKTNRVT